MFVVITYSLCIVIHAKYSGHTALNLSKISWNSAFGLMITAEGLADYIQLHAEYCE